MTKNNIALSLSDAVSYLNQFHGSTFLIKLGGSILEDEALIESLCFDLKILKKAGINLIIVHGGSKAINQHLSTHNIQSKFVDGLRVTSSEAMKVIEMVLCGHINKILVRKLNSIGVNAIGLSGTDNNMLLCDFYSEKHGYAGVIHSINPKLITHFSDAIPVIAPIGVNTEGDPMNLNADYAASHIAITLKVDKLIYLTDQDGVYDKNGNICSELSSNDLVKFIKDGTVKEGMLTKTKAILSALNNNLNHVHILNGNKNHILIKELFTLKGVGTLCKKMETMA